MIIIVYVIAAVFAYAFIRERQDRRRVERERNMAMEQAGRLAASNRRIELDRAFRDGVDAANATNTMYNRFMRQAMNGQGTIKLCGSRGAPLSSEEWRRSHGNTEHHS